MRHREQTACTGDGRLSYRGRKMVNCRWSHQSRYTLCPDQKKAEKTARKRARTRQKPTRRTIQLVKERRPYFLLQFDTIVVFWNGPEKYILSTLAHATKIGYSRMHKNRSSRVTADCLYRLRYLANQPIGDLQTDICYSVLPMWSASTDY